MGRSSDEYKKSLYVDNLYYDPKSSSENFFLFDKQQGCVIFFYASSNSGTVSDVYIVSKDPNVKNIDAEEGRSAAEQAMQIVKTKKAEKNAEIQKQLIEKRKIPVENMKNPNLAKQALTCLNENATKNKFGHTFSKAYICSKDWEIVKQQYTGSILYRTLEIGVTYEKEGKCFVDYFVVKQEYAGSDFQKHYNIME